MCRPPKAYLHKLAIKLYSVRIMYNLIVIPFNSNSHNIRFKIIKLLYEIALRNWKWHLLININNFELRSVNQWWAGQLLCWVVSELIISGNILGKLHGYRRVTPTITNCRTSRFGCVSIPVICLSLFINSPHRNWIANRNRNLRMYAD